MIKKRLLKKFKKLQEIIGKKSHGPPICDISLKDATRTRIKSTQVIQVDNDNQRIGTGIEGIITAFFRFDEILKIEIRNK
jgi:hypothetical protein